MSQLVLVDNRHFLKEYIWHYHSDYIKGKMPYGLRLIEFEEWKTSNLSGHILRIEANININ